LFLNGAVRVETSLAPQALLDALLAIETSLGRRREARWGPRTIDLDLLLYGNLVQETPDLVVPHPRMAWRRFVLEPAAEVGGSLLHPSTGWTVAELLDHLNTARPFLALAGLPGTGKTRLARHLAEKASAECVSAPAAPPTGRRGSGSDWKREVEFLEIRTRLLSADAQEWFQPKPLWVSDFWLDQSLAYAEVTLDADRYDAFRRRWEEARSRVVQPKLTVLLDPPPLASRPPQSSPHPLAGEGQGPRTESSETASRDRQASAEEQRLRGVLRRLAREPGHGPVFHLVEGDPQRVLVQVLAALEAMA
jgi:hypothetical protein